VGGTCGTLGWRGEVFTYGFGWETRREKPLGRPWCRGEDKIKMDLGEIGIRLAKDRVRLRAFVGTVMNLRVP
jgi:hypothetical protein